MTMADEFTVNTADLCADAAVWRDWQVRLNALGTGVPIVGRDIEPLAFSLMPGAQAVQAAYASLAGRLADEIATGSTTFTGVADKLAAVASLYEDAENDILKALATL